MKQSRISGFQWAISIFVFFVIAYASPLILQDFQKASGLKPFVFMLNSLGPFIAALICLLIFKHKREQLSGLKLTINLKVIERLLLAVTLPMIIFIGGMYMFNTYADSFILLQSKDLSETIWTILIGHLLMAFFIEFGFRLYLFNLVESKIPHFFANIFVSFLYLIWDINTSFGMPYTMYSAIYVFAFSMIIGELIRGTGGRAIYIVTVFHATMTFAKVFFFSEELGDVFSMKVLAYSTAAVAVVVVTLGLFASIIHYFQRKRQEKSTATTETKVVSTDQPITDTEEKVTDTPTKPDETNNEVTSDKMVDGENVISPTSENSTDKVEPDSDTTNKQPINRNIHRT
ncbi:CPBP family intramembrane glutamic endopeptidase [Staphylococcus americanisciuri]|uniref:CPBP family intramembrane metalloprotease n=1 Tax=Staphylococcus americanisciuri TaxID=2973940 RepID=A0ABT2F0U3_9STAP|nr:CPBP family intramembrane glutamic endopeptidase [Staphylococcus americanisciuri]MCS4486068.1 CPBP family intramembrane metalloprotease [Staphylococcus americanisciuri]